MRLVHECSLGLQRTGAELGHRATRSGPPERRSARNAAFRSRSGCRFALANHGLRADNLASMLRHRSFDFLSVRRRELHAARRPGRFARSPGGYWRWAFRGFARKAGRWPIRSRCIRATGSRSRRIPARSKRKSIKSNQYDTSEINLHAGRRGSGANPRKVQRRADERRRALGAQVKRAAELIRLCREKLRQGRTGSIRSLEEE